MLYLHLSYNNIPEIQMCIKLTKTFYCLTFNSCNIYSF